MTNSDIRDMRKHYRHSARYLSYLGYFREYGTWPNGTTGDVYRAPTGPERRARWEGRPASERALAGIVERLWHAGWVVNLETRKVTRY